MPEEKRFVASGAETSAVWRPAVPSWLPCWPGIEEALQRLLEVVRVMLTEYTEYELWRTHAYEM